MFRIGITGTIGSGKSTVGKILEQLRVPVSDSDKIVHKLLDQDQEVQQLVCDRFGQELLVGSGKPTIDRRALGAKVFNDEAARKDLEKILHPRVRTESKRWMQRFAQENAAVDVVANLVPLLFETGAQVDYDEVWTVVADEQSLFDRLAERDGLSKAEIEKRVRAQFPQDKKRTLAHRVIDNSGSLAETRRQVEKFLDEIAAGRKQS